MNVPALLSQLGIPHRTAGQHHHVRGNWTGCDCPRCSPRSSRFKLGISPDGRCNCWTCGGMRLGDALHEITGRPLGELLELIRGLERGVERREERPQGRLVIPSNVGGLLPPHRRYLERRGFDPDEISRLWGVMGIGPVGRLAWRLWLPIQHRGETVSWTTRAIGELVERRYINAGVEEEAVPAKSLLYGADLARHAVVVCEGPLDAWAVGPGGVATMGLVVSREQVLEIGRYPVRAVCFDAEPDAQRQARALCRTLQCLPGETHLVELETGKDAAEADNREVAELRKKFLD